MYHYNKVQLHFIIGHGSVSTFKINEGKSSPLLKSELPVTPPATLFPSHGFPAIPPNNVIRHDVPLREIQDELGKD